MEEVKPKLILAESSVAEAEAFRKSLSEWGFDVSVVHTKKDLDRLLDTEGVVPNVVLSSGDLEDGWGHESCYHRRDLLKNSFVAGMSSLGGNRICWSGIASHNGFFMKNTFYRNGEVVVGEVVAREFAHYLHVRDRCKCFYKNGG